MGQKNALVHGIFFLLERHLGQVPWSLSVLSLSLFATSRLAPWTRGMHLCMEGSIKISYRKIEMFHLPSYSIALITHLNVRKFANGATTGSKQVSVLGFAVEVVDK